MNGFEYHTKNSSNNRNRMKFAAFIFLLILFGGVLARNLKLSTFENGIPHEDNIAVAKTVSGISPHGLPEYEQAIIEATQKALPAVVSINTYGTRIVEIRDPFLRMLYGGRVGQQQTISGMGSGVIIDPDGIVITNDHVIGFGLDASIIIQVTLSDGRTFEGNLIKSFPSQDIAILSIDGENLPYLEFGSSADVVQGQTAIAIGNPFGSKFTGGLSGGEPTITRGIISATKRSLTITADGIDRYYRNMLQTDASINQGNSGGALINIQGKLIGINTAIYTAGDAGSIGIGFAIPSDRIRLVFERVKRYGDIGTPYTGISVEEMTKPMREAVNLKTQGGIIVTSIRSGSPGDKAGFKRGDVITGVNGLFISTIKEVQWMFQGAVPGEVYTLTVYRDDSFMEKDIKLGDK